MKINTEAIHVQITPAVSDYLNKRLSALEKFIDSDDDGVVASVKLAKTTEHHKTGDVFRAEIELHVPGKDFFTFSENQDLNTAIDLAKDEMLREMRAWKGKRVTETRRSGREIKNTLKGLKSAGGK